MERYSTLWGTEQAGPYGRLGSSKRLGNFLTQKIGAANVKDVVELTEKLVTGIVMLPGYEKETLINKPLAVVYAPLYLEKMPNMTKGMKGFCALAVSGLEHRAVRESSFSHTWFFPREDMLTGNYLDQLMGTQLTTSHDVDLHREGSLQVNFNRLPQKVQPQLVQKDLPTVLLAIDALYQKKNAVLILEEGVNFNRRSMDILTQIYSMMQPMLATETGFATYQTQKRILELVADTNVQIFVVPAGTDLSGLPASKFKILDVTNPVKPENRSLIETLVKWANMDWSLRSRAMAHLFAENNDYANGELFVNLSEAFFAQASDLNNWYNDDSRNKSLTTLAELQAEDKISTGWKLVPWAKELFNKKYPELLNNSVEKLNARNVAAFYEYNGADEALKSRSRGTVDFAAVKNAAMQYQYGRTLAGTDEEELCGLIWEKADQRVGVGYRAQLANQEAQHKQTVESLKQDHRQQIEIKDRKIADKDNELAEQKTKFDTAWETREGEYRQKWDEREADHNAAMTAAVAAEAAKTAAVQKELDAADQKREAHIRQLNQEHEEHIRQLNQEHQNTINNIQKQANLEKGNLQTSLDQANRNNSALQTSLDQANQNNNALQTSLDQANRNNSALQTSLNQANQNNDALQTNLNQVNLEKGNLQAELKQANQEKGDLQNELTQTKRNYAVLEQEFQQATGHAPTPPTPTVKIGPFELPRPVVSMLAITAAATLILGLLLGFIISNVLGGEKTYDLQWSANNVVNDAGEMGKITLSHDDAEAGETVTVTVIPDEGWQIDSVSCQFGTAITKVSDNKYTFVMPAQEETILVSFSELPPPPAAYSIQWAVNGQVGNAGEMGTVTLSQVAAEAGETVTATVIPAEGWLLDEVKCQSGAALTAVSDSEYSFVMPEQEETIHVSFSQIPPEPTALNEDGTINWEYLTSEVTWIHTAETDPEEMAKILGKDAIESEEWVQEGILLPEGWDAETKDVVNPYILVLRAENYAVPPEEEEQPDAAALELMKNGWLVVDNGDRCLVIPSEASDAQDSAWTKTMDAAMKVMDLLTEKDNSLDVLAYRLDDKRTIDLQEMATAAGMSSDWWLELDKISFKKSDAEDAAYLIGTPRTIVMTVMLDDGTKGAILDYNKLLEKGDVMVGLMEEKGRNASFVGDFVLVMLNGSYD